MLHMLYPQALYIGLPALLLAAYWFWFHYKNPVYIFSSLTPLQALSSSALYRRLLLFLLRLAMLTTLLLAIARFQKPDERSKIPVQGIDIMLVLDTSESMNAQESELTKKTRMDSAREEALKFIEKRDNDPIGLVIFSGVAVSRSPLTLDKRVLREILTETTTHTIPAPGTALSRAILTAANRLKKSTAKSRIMIVLTDGVPMGDIDPRLAIDMAKKLGIKIYTIGIGSEETEYIDHPFYGRIQMLNIPLLKTIAAETGGQFFLAQDSTEMKRVYDTIDTLERTEHETPLFARYFEYFMPLLWLTFFLLLSEILITTLWWIRL